MSPRSKELSEEMRVKSRTALINAARKLFAEIGYFKCRISDIAKEAGMSQGNVYWYFSSKEELLKAVLAEGFDTLGALMANAANQKGVAPEKLDCLLDNLIDFSKLMGEFNTITLSLVGHGGDDLLKQLGFDMSQIGMGYTKSINSIVIQGQEEGTIDKGSESLTLTIFFFGLFNGLNLTYGTEWTEIPENTIKEATKRLIGVI